MIEGKDTYLVIACVFPGCLLLLQLLKLLHECQTAPETLLFLHGLSEGQSVIDPLSEIVICLHDVHESVDDIIMLGELLVQLFLVVSSVVWLALL